MLAHRLRRWPNIKPTSAYCVIFSIPVHQWVFPVLAWRGYTAPCLGGGTPTASWRVDVSLSMTSQPSSRSLNDRWINHRSLYHMVFNPVVFSVDFLARFVDILRPHTVIAGVYCVTSLSPFTGHYYVSDFHHYSTHNVFWIWQILTTDKTGYKDSLRLIDLHRSDLIMIRGQTCIHWVKWWFIVALFTISQPLSISVNKRFASAIPRSL